MRRVAGMCVLLALWLGFAEVASSGDSETPFSFGACGGVSIAGDRMRDPIGAFDSGLDSCEKSCRKAAKQCEGYVKDNAGCQQRYVKQAAGWSSENCEALYPEDPELRRECKQAVKNDFVAAKSLLKANREDALDDCEFWGITCAQDCDPG
jgi:hypothetical protein